MRVTCWHTKVKTKFIEQKSVFAIELNEKLKGFCLAFEYQIFGIN